MSGVLVYSTDSLCKKLTKLGLPVFIINWMFLCVRIQSKSKNNGGLSSALWSSTGVWQWPYIVYYLHTLSVRNAIFKYTDALLAQSTLILLSLTSQIRRIFARHRKILAKPISAKFLPKFSRRKTSAKIWLDKFYMLFSEKFTNFLHLWIVGYYNHNIIQHLTAYVRWHGAVIFT